MRLIRLVAALAFWSVCIGTSQAQRGGFGPPGSFGPGGFGGAPGGGPGGGGFMSDPNRMFEFLSKGRPYFLISETRSFREPLMVYAKENGISNEQITRQHFASFFAKKDQYFTRAGVSGGPGGPGGRRSFGGPGGGPPGMMMPPQGPGGPGPGAIAPGQNPLDAINQWAEADFRRRDQNGDNQLNPDEMSGSLREQLDRWDTNRDGLVSLDEYKVYFGARLQMRDGGDRASTSTPVTVIIEDDYDRRPTVLRAGKLPVKDLPKWFMELDTDSDGQVGLYEWRSGGRDLEEFGDWDRNGDGLVTAEEALGRMRSDPNAMAANNSSGRGFNGGDRRSNGGGEGDRRGPGGDGRGGDGERRGPGGRPGGFGGFGGPGSGNFGGPGGFMKKRGN